MIKKMTQDALPSSCAGQDTVCPIALSQRIVGDRWTVLVLRELFLGSHRFEEIQAQIQATPQMLTSRLKKLESDGVIERRAYNQRPLRHEYHLTEMGLGFYPVFLALRAWGETWCKPRKQEVAIHYKHIPCGKNPGLGTTCQECGQVLRREELCATLSKPFVSERQIQKEAFKGLPASS